MLVHVSATATRPVAARRATLAIGALGMGAFGIGISEFVVMGLLPEIARGVDVDIPTAGHVVSAYAFGVVVGAPLIAATAARLPRKGLLVGLLAAFLAGTVLTAVAPGYGTLLAARFVAGLPHGAYFGVASLVAASLVPPEAKGRAVSSVMLGLSVATLAGVPAATWLGQQLGWRTAFVRWSPSPSSPCWRCWPSCRGRRATRTPPCAPSSGRCAGRRSGSPSAWPSSGSAASSPSTPTSPR